MPQQTAYFPPAHAYSLNKKRHANNTFYVVSIKKLIALLMITFGFYTIYWSYKNWSVVKQHNPKYAQCNPLVRAIFSFFYLPVLFNCIQNKAKQEKVRMSFSAWHLAAACILLSISAVALISSGVFYLTWLGVLSAVCALLPIVKMQKVINYTEHDPTGWANHKFTSFNWLCVVAGASYTSLFALATFMLIAT
ncbi:hypothetical protein N7931_05865 [Catenovulum sp. 2E275]|uniref:hypothetical protein n=1 Tax=Catenovulum sp. 2E275 TaxID=2980497 RepID=UPI0021D1D594|nr:hypothetical protein [Catenovulum sp. 2E275]MCU4675155.1 hypothetical protein [Catenovulum sp. 2E275]